MIFERNVLALDITGLAQALAKRRRRLGARTPLQENPDHRHRRLRARGEWDARRSGAEKRDELAASHRVVVHSITSSAVASSDGGTSTPIARAVARLMTNSNLVARATGRSE